MRETAIVSSAPDDLHDGVRMSTTPEGGSLLEQLPGGVEEDLDSRRTIGLEQANDGVS